MVKIERVFITAKCFWRNVEVFFLWQLAGNVIWQ